MTLAGLDSIMGEVATIVARVAMTAKIENCMSVIDFCVKIDLLVRLKTDKGLCRFDGERSVGEWKKRGLYTEAERIENISVWSAWFLEARRAA